MMIFDKILLLLCIVSFSVSADSLCDSAFDASNYKQSGECYIQKLKKNKSMHNYLYAGISLENQGRCKEAISYLKEAEKRARSNDDYNYIYSHLGNMYANTGDKKAALAYYMKSLDISLKGNNNNNIGMNYSNLGTYFSDMNDDVKALEYYKKSFDYLDENQRASTYSWMALSYQKLKEFDKAEESYKKSIILDEQTGDYSGLCSDKRSYGSFFYEQNRINEAKVLLEETKDICSKAGDISSLARAFSSLSLIYFKNGDKELAVSYSNQSTILANKSGDSRAVDRAIYSSKVIHGEIIEE